MSWKERLSEENQSKLRSQTQPEWTPPMLATLTYEPFSDSEWIYERKLDGQRLLAFRNGPAVRLMSRNRKSNTDRYPEIVEALKRLDRQDFIVDGEVVAFEGKVSSFSKLQPRMQVRASDEAKRSSVKVFYYIFDILHLEGCDVTRIPLRDRKAILRRVFRFEDPLRFTPHRNHDGKSYLDEACKSGWEGLIAKQASSLYQHSRSKDWLKFKCSKQQEFVIGGFTDPQGARIGFGALMVGFYDGDSLQYAGKVGTGYDRETLRDLHKTLSGIERKTPPFSGNGLPVNNVHWVAPRLVADIGFTEWTSDNKLRHPRYLGLRDDKNPEEVVKEDAVASPS